VLQQSAKHDPVSFVSRLSEKKRAGSNQKYCEQYQQNAEHGKNRKKGEDGRTRRDKLQALPRQAPLTEDIGGGRRRENGFQKIPATLAAAGKSKHTMRKLGQM